MTRALGNVVEKEELKLSNHNYSQYSNKKNKDSNAASSKPVMPRMPVEPVKPAPEVKMEPVITEPVKPTAIDLVQETVDTVTLPKTVEGVVVDCVKLNIRTEPDIHADVACVLDVMSELKIDVSKSNNEWFKVSTATGVEGYCMRKFVDAHL